MFLDYNLIYNVLNWFLVGVAFTGGSVIILHLYVKKLMNNIFGGIGGISEMLQNPEIIKKVQGGGIDEVLDMILKELGLPTFLKPVLMMFLQQFFGNTNKQNKVNPNIWA